MMVARHARHFRNNCKFVFGDGRFCLASLDPPESADRTANQKIRSLMYRLDRSFFEQGVQMSDFLGVAVESIG